MAVAQPQTQLLEVLGALPRVDLHRHLEGSLRLRTLVQLSREEGLPLPQEEAALGRHVQIQHDDRRNSPIFLSKFEVLRTFYRSPEIIQRVTREAIADAAADNVRYLELRFTPIALASARGFPLGEVADWVIAAAQDEAARRGIRVGMILSMNRHEPLGLAEQMAQLAIDRAGRGIVALDLAGDEANFTAEAFASIFSTARQAGLGTTAHAGEWAGPESVRFALEGLQVDRIGHGVRVLENQEVVALARERRTVFEVCLTSNYHSGVISRMADHPLPAMVDAGLQVTLNSDDPGVSNIRLSEEQLAAVVELGLSMETLHGLTLAAAQAAFLPEAGRRALEAELQAAFGLA
ncbi:MAG TPA: adenosine deaminase [Anaerolineales bacterium]|nr:adenosine deaminase [Anaerolineales bacterium]